MSNEENSISGISKSTRVLTLDGSLINENIISVWGNNLKEVYEVFSKEKNNDWFNYDNYYRGFNGPSDSWSMEK